MGFFNLLKTNFVFPKMGASFRANLESINRETTELRTCVAKIVPIDGLVDYNILKYL